MPTLLPNKANLPSKQDALAGRQQKMLVPAQHYVNGNTLQAPFLLTFKPRYLV